MTDTKQLGQYPTPLWFAEAIIERYFPDLDMGDTVVEPSCGPGRFLQALPAHVSAVGVEIDPVLAEQARATTGRPIITGDFCSVPLNVEPTAIIGNPPFSLDIIDRFLDRAHGLLPEGGRLGFILPTYAFQTAKRVTGYADKWSLFQEMIPRNIYHGLSKPLCFAVFSKDRERSLVGFAFYRQAAAAQDLPREYRDMIGQRTWRDVVDAALSRLGGVAKLTDIYSEVEGNRPTSNQFWREKIRQVLGRNFVRVGAGEYARPDMVAA